MLKFDYSFFDVFRTYKRSSSGRLVYAVLWYCLHAVRPMAVCVCVCEAHPDFDRTAYTDA